MLSIEDINSSYKGQIGPLDGTFDIGENKYKRTIYIIVSQSNFRASLSSLDVINISDIELEVLNFHLSPSCEEQYSIAFLLLSHENFVHYMLSNKGYYHAIEPDYCAHSKYDEDIDMYPSPCCKQCKYRFIIVSPYREIFFEGVLIAIYRDMIDVYPIHRNILYLPHSLIRILKYTYTLAQDCIIGIEEYIFGHEGDICIKEKDSISLIYKDIYSDIDIVTVSQRLY